MESDRVGMVRSSMAPVVGGIVALALALGLCAGLVALGQKVYPSGDPRAPRLFRQFLPAGLGGAATFYSFQRVPMDLELRETTAEPVDSRSQAPERMNVHIVVSPIGGILLVGVVLAVGGYLAWRIRGRRGDRILGSAASMALVFALASLGLSFVLPLGETILEPQSLARRSSHVTYTPSHLGAFVWPLFWAFTFGVLGMHIAKHGRAWRKRLIDNVARRSSAAADALHAAIAGLAVGAVLVVLAGVATGAVAIVQHPGGAGDVLGSGKNVAGLAEGVAIGLPHATGAGLLGSMAVPARFESSTNDGRGGTAGTGSLFGVTTRHDFGSRAIAVPRYALGGLGIAGIFTFVTGYRAAVLAGGDKRRGLRAALLAAGMQTVLLWFVAYLIRAEARMRVGIEPSAETRAEIGTSLLGVAVLPVVWTVVGGMLGALVGLRSRGRVADIDEVTPARTRATVGPMILGSAIVAVLAVAVGVLASARLVDGVPSVTASRTGWNVYTDPRNGWTVEFPASWYAQPFLEEQRGGPYTAVNYGVLLSNIERRFEHPEVGKNEWTPAFDMRGLPADAVVLRVGYAHGGGFAIYCPNTPFPLTLKSAERSTTKDGADGTTQTVLNLPFVAQSVPGYGVTAWIGSTASEADRQVLERIVASISFEGAKPGPDPQSKELCP